MIDLIDEELKLDFDSLADSLENVVSSNEGTLAQPQNESDASTFEEQQIKTQDQSVSTDEIFVDPNELDPLEELTKELEKSISAEDKEITTDESDVYIDEISLDESLDEIFDNVDEISETKSEEPEFEQDDVELESVEDSNSYAEIQYPCLILNGANTVEEIEFLKTFSTEQTKSKAIYLYCEAKQGVCEVGYVNLDLKFLLTLSRMPGYKLYVLGSENSKRSEIDLTNAKNLLKFI